jgi:hypothetical protein
MNPASVCAFSGQRLCSASSTRSGQEIELFAIDWLKRGILVERETSVLPSAAEAVRAAKLRAHDVARRHPGQEPDTFRLTDATGKILGVFPKNPNAQRR